MSGDGVSEAQTQTPAVPIEEKVAELEQELARQQQMLARAGIGEDVASLSVAQREELGRLETRFQQLQADHQALSQAIDKGLHPSLVRENMRKLEEEMDALQQQMNAIRTGENEQQTTASKATAPDLEARMTQLETELAARRGTESKAGESTDESAADTERPPTFRERMNELLPVEIFAFGDFMYRIEEDAPDNFAIGQLEMDITQDLIDEVTITAAIAYDGESESIGVGAFTIDGRILGSDDSYLRKTTAIDSLGVIFGQFDVPFGIDYLEYASIDRRLVTGPIAVDGTHGGWNDLGAQVYLIAPRFNAVLYGVNGYGYETVEQDAAGNQIAFEHPTAMALGGRLGVRGVEQLEVGGSLATFFNADAELTQMLAGGDLSLDVASLAVKGEYIYAAQGMEMDGTTRTHGFYGGALYDFDPVFVTGRYSMLWPDGESDEKQLSVGVGVKVFENAEIRVEYATSLETGGSMAFIQLAGGSAWQPSGMRR